MNDHPAQPVERPVGLETEYGILKPGDPRANPVAAPPPPRRPPPPPRATPTSTSTAPCP